MQKKGSISNSFIPIQSLNGSKTKIQTQDVQSNSNNKVISLEYCKCIVKITDQFISDSFIPLIDNVVKQFQKNNMYIILYFV